MKDKMRGCLYGQAIGDALGLGTEFLNREEVRKAYPNGISKFEDIIQDAHRRRWHKGAWTDDTDMMILPYNLYNGLTDQEKINDFISLVINEKG